jgi:hypothetical protein
MVAGMSALFERMNTFEEEMQAQELAARRTQRDFKLRFSFLSDESFSNDAVKRDG